ncbi:hypothetical protein OA005_02420 [Paracoccaceae bacterium]|nr:hypothetical protein [Paracoccaceae bacterium]
MVDSIIANSTAPQLQPVQNRSVSNAAVSDASSMPDNDIIDDVIDVSPRAMDSDSNNAFSSAGAPELRPPIENNITSGAQLRPALENFLPLEMTTERALENRIADIDLATNNEIDETDTEMSINNSNAIAAFSDQNTELQQAIDISA